MEPTTIAIDLAKRVFRIHFVDPDGRIHSKVLKRDQMLPFFANRPAARIVMEACGSAHHWARQLTALGHERVKSNGGIVSQSRLRLPPVPKRPRLRWLVDQELVPFAAGDPERLSAPTAPERAGYGIAILRRDRTAALDPTWLEFQFSEQILGSQVELGNHLLYFPNGVRQFLSAGKLGLLLKFLNLGFQIAVGRHGIFSERESQVIVMVRSRLDY